MRNISLNSEQQNIRLKIPYRYGEIVKKQSISLNYDINDHVYSIQNPSNYVVNQIPSQIPHRSV